jgi:hypothetical protein
MPENNRVCWRNQGIALIERHERGELGGAHLIDAYLNEADLKDAWLRGA